ncbi:cag pathogenicity island protein 11 [Pantoea alhagi]|uniref:hypothetical protein n=1 Tax=Mixta sp. BE291 TaxID=3158787 RepID=UPI0028620921|nr:cag pathogenicity island protein 11 [Pantoea alhagi]
MRVFVGYLLLTSCAIGIILMACSFITYAFNRKKYYGLLDLYRRSQLDFPMPYSFQSMMGFFGAWPVSQFFLSLKKGKKIFFLAENSNAYDFFKQHYHADLKWMSRFYWLWTTALLLVASPCLVVFFL